jgi:beta-galactosidase
MTAGLLIASLAPTAAADEAAFPAKDMMTVGVYYYPEAWPKEQWPRDLANIKRFGFEFVHMGEFAWAFMEPEEGRFEFGWLEENVRLAAAQGLKVVLCTPSATPERAINRSPGRLAATSAVKVRSSRAVASTSNGSRVAWRTPGGSGNRAGTRGAT